MKRKTWLTGEAAQSRKRCWSIAHRLITLNTHSAAHILGRGELSQTLAAHLQPARAGGAVNPPVPPTSGSLMESGGTRSKKRLFSVKSSDTPPSFSRQLFFLFPPSLGCALYIHFPLGCCCDLAGAASSRLQLCPFPYIDCRLFLTEDPVWLKHQPRAS